MTAPPPKRSDFTTFKTTLPARPLPANSERETIVTERLILRPLNQDDLPAYHSLRRQPEVMKYTMLGRIDKDIEESQSRLSKFLPPEDVGTYNFAICLRETGELIGVGGNHNASCSWGWPEVGYMLRKEQWGKGLATEFLKAFLAAWEKLPRAEAEVETDARTVEGLPEVDGRVSEQLFAITELENGRSQNTLQKCGFEYFCTWKAQNTTGENGERIDLPTYRFLPNKKAT